MQEGFKDRSKANTKNWEGKHLSKEDFVYFTIAYPFFYGSNAADDKDSKAAVIKVEIDEQYLYPDEDFLRQATHAEDGIIEIKNYKHVGEKSLEMMGNVAVKDLDKIKIISMKEFDVVEMSLWCDPCMTIMNFRILGKYYTNLVENWYNDRKWQMTITEYFAANN